LTWSQVDLDNSIVRLEVGETKNDDARTVYLDDELQAVFQKQWERRKSGKKILPYVFPKKGCRYIINNLLLMLIKNDVR
jgi:integrase